MCLLGHNPIISQGESLSHSHQVRFQFQFDTENPPSTIPYRFPTMTINSHICKPTVQISTSKNHSGSVWSILIITWGIRNSTCLTLLPGPGSTVEEQSLVGEEKAKILTDNTISRWSDWGIGTMMVLQRVCSGICEIILTQLFRMFQLWLPLSQYQVLCLYVTNSFMCVKCVFLSLPFSIPTFFKFQLEMLSFRGSFSNWCSLGCSYSSFLVVCRV